MALGSDSDGYGSKADSSTSSTADYDVVILGGGSGGYACALRSAQLGMTVAVIEDDKLGGTCLHRGCIPTKALLHAAEVADEVRGGPDIGIVSRLDGIDMAKVNSYQNGVVSRLHKGLVSLVNNAGSGSGSIETISGRGHMSGPTSVRVGDREVTGSHVVLATGSVPRLPDGVSAGDRAFTSDEALTLTEVPGSAVIIGGSVIGVEFASIWRSFGAEVTVVEALDRLVPQEDPAMSKQLARAFRKRGIKTHTSSMLKGIEQHGDQVTATLDDGTSVDADVALLAIGRGPNSVGLGLDDHGVDTDRGWVTTDERLRTSAAGVYAVGDLVPGPQLAHRGFAHGIFVAEDIAGLHPVPIIDTDIPRVTYCDPQIASVGLTEPQAIAQYGEDDVRVYEYNLAGNGKSQILRTGGIVRAIRRTDGPIVGVHMIGARFGEQIGEASLLVNWDAFPEDLASVIHAHPTQNEALGEVAMALAGKPLHAPA